MFNTNHYQAIVDFSDKRLTITMFNINEINRFKKGRCSIYISFIDLQQTLIASVIRMKPKHVCLFVLRLNVPVNNFSVVSERSQLFLGLTSTVGS